MKNFFFPLTVPGTAAFLAVLFLFGKGYADSDYQSVFISAVFFILFALIAAALYYFSKKNYLNEIVKKAKGDISTSSSDKNVQNIIFEERSPLFFRYSAVVKGRFFTSGKSFLFYDRYTSDRDGKIEFSYNFESPGLLKGTLKYFLEDIFGLMRVPCGPPEEIDVRIIPGIPDKALINKKDTLTSLVKNKKPDENDYEKILMREYMHGDRSRDINWKASSKSNTIYTKIAPGNDHEINKINLVYCQDPDLFNQNIYSGFLLYRYFREYFRFFINTLFTSENYRFNVFINGKKISAEDRHGLDIVYRELSLPGIRNDFEKSVQDEEGSFVVFCEKPETLEDLKHVFLNSSGVRFFFPSIVKNEYSENRSERNDFSGYRIKGDDFSSPGKGVFPGISYFRDMRGFFKDYKKPESLSANDSDVRCVEITASGLTKKQSRK